MDHLLGESTWRIWAFAGLWSLLMVALRQQRPALMLQAGLFACARLMLVLSSRLGAQGHLLATPALVQPLDYLHALALVLEGAALVSLAGLIVFRLLQPNLGRPTPRIVQDVAVLAGQGMWLLAVLNYHSVNVSAIIATSTIITAVVGFAMQDTLGNLIAGLAIQMDASLRVGDWIEVDEVAGCIADIRGRHTVVETRDWETVLIPNSVLVRSKVRLQGMRRGQPSQARRKILFHVDYRYPPWLVTDVVEKDLNLSRVPGVGSAPPPRCLVSDYGDSYAVYKVVYFLTTLEHPSSVDSAVRTHIFSSLQRAGMSLAMPAQAIFMTQDTPERRQRKAQDARADRLRAMRMMRIFAALPDAELETMAEGLIYAPYSKGDVLVRQGEEPHWLYLLVEGTVERTVGDEQGNETRVSDLGAGDTFGEWSLTTGSKRETTVRATSEVRCYRLPREVFIEALGRHQELAQHIAEQIAQRRTLLEEALHNLSEESSRRRTTENVSTVLEGLRHLLGV